MCPLVSAVLRKPCHSNASSASVSLNSSEMHSSNNVPFPLCRSSLKWTSCDDTTLKGRTVSSTIFPTISLYGERSNWNHFLHLHHLPSTSHLNPTLCKKYLHSIISTMILHLVVSDLSLDIFYSMSLLQCFKYLWLFFCYQQQLLHRLITSLICMSLVCFHSKWSFTGSRPLTQSLLTPFLQVIQRMYQLY